MYIRKLELNLPDLVPMKHVFEITVCNSKDNTDDY